MLVDHIKLSSVDVQWRRCFPAGIERDASSFVAVVVRV